MRILLSHPWCWPEVQRGGERLFADLTEHLARAGHDVLAVSASSKAEATTTAAGARRVVLRARGGELARRLRIDQAVTYLPELARSIRRFEPDVFHGMYHLDGVAARAARFTPRVVHVQGMPRRGALAGRPIQRRLLPLSMDAPSTLVAVSRAAAQALEDELGYTALVLHNGVHTEPFVQAGLEEMRSPWPSVLFPSAGADVRKRLDLLVEALGAISTRWPDLRLVVAATASASLRQRVESVSQVAIDWLAVRGPAAMPSAYARCWVTAAPAVREAFGLVFVEALAAGKPAVGVDDGGVPEVIQEQRWIAVPDDAESLASALDCALQDAEAPGTADACRARAADFDWRVRGPAFVALYQELSATVPSS